MVGFSKSSGWRAARLRNFKIVQGLAYVKWNAEGGTVVFGESTPYRLCGV
jgi:hypothetical protein